MSQASDNASMFATRADHNWLGQRARVAINAYAQGRRIDPTAEPELAAILYFHLIEIIDQVERNDLAEAGRRLANRRDDLIAAGVNPADLAIPIHPDDRELA